MSDNTEKTLDELRAAIEQDAPEQDSATENDLGDTGTQVNAESDLDASEEEETSKSASQDDSSEETDDEQWVVPGRFKTNEDVLEGYRQLESHSGRQSSEIQKLRSSIDEPPQRGESEEEKNARLKRFADELSKDPEAAINARIRNVVGEAKQGARASEFKRVYEARIADTNSDFAELDPVMAQIATKYGDMIMENGMQNDPRLLDILHLAARGIKAEEAAQKANAKGVAKGKEVSRQKNKARLETPSGKTKSKKLDTSKMTSAQMKSAFEKGDLEF